MALGAVGLKTHIWNNHFACGVLLLCYPVLILLLIYLGSVAMVAFTPAQPPVYGQAASPDIWHGGLVYAKQVAPFAVGVVAVWYLIATFMHRHIINSVTHAKSVTRADEPKLYSLLENLCISRGLPMPNLAIIETGALNAFASGLSPNSAQVTVTRGLLESLDDEALEGVLAHELSHVINRDIELLIVSAVFVGLLAFLCEWSWRSLRYQRGSKKGGQVLLVIALVSTVGYGCSMLLRFALSRKREYLADAGAVELTKNPDAMVRALSTISGRSDLPHVPSDFKEMMIDYPRVGFFGMFATHPPIEDRIAVLQRYAGATPPAPKPKRSPWKKRKDIWQ